MTMTHSEAMDHGQRRLTRGRRVHEGMWKAIGYLLCAQLVSGCAVPLNPAKLSEAEARARAVALANDQAQELFRVDPFTLDHGGILFEAGQWQWESRVPVGRTEVEGRVTFMANGEQASVRVGMFVLPVAEPQPARTPSLRLDRTKPAWPSQPFKK